MEWNKLDKTALSVCDLADQDDDLEYWLSRTPQERFEAIEHMRRMLYGNDPTAATFQRVLEVVDLAQL